VARGVGTGVAGDGVAAGAANGADDTPSGAIDPRGDDSGAVAVAPATAPADPTDDDAGAIPLPAATEPIPMNATTPMMKGARRRERRDLWGDGGTDDMYHPTPPDANVCIIHANCATVAA